MVSIDDCKIIELPKIQDSRGNLTFIEQNKHVPFDIKRIFYLYDVPGGESRADHANKYTTQFLIAMSGSFDIIVDDGKNKKRIHLNRAYNGVLIPKMIWRGIDNFSSGAVCLSVVDTEYLADDYIREYDEYINEIKTN